MLLINAVTSRSRAKKNKNRGSPRQDGWPEKIIRWRYRAGKRDVTRRCYEMHHPRRTSSATRGGETILCIKQKAPQCDIPPRRFILTFRAYFKRVARLEIRERHRIGIHQTAVYAMCTYNARAIFLFLYISRTYHIRIHTGGCTNRAHRCKR